MAKAVKTAEVAIIDFTKFDIQQLPEFIGKKEEIKAVIKANPIVEITDNATYESAKKSRTAVKTTRTGLEKEKKDVADRIKNNVLGVVNTEYDKLIEDVKKEEALRQEKVTAWETKKEEERVEKARLEQERIDGIKNSISEFRRNWDDVVFMLTFDKIEDVREDYSVAVLEFDRSKLAEFEILFDDSVVYLDNLFANKEKTLREQEQIRLDNVVLEEKKSEMAKISAFEKSWNANIDTLKFRDISKDLKNSLEKGKLVDLKHYQDEFNEKYTSIENRLNAQIEFVSKQESQRLAEEKLEKEKAEFEKKQAEAKFQERKKFLVDEEYWRIYLLVECGEEEDVAKGKLLNFTDSEFEDFKSSVLKAKEPINPFQEVEFEEEPIYAEQGRLIDKDGVLFDTVLNKPHVPSNLKVNPNEVADNSKNELIPAKLVRLPNGETVWATKEGVESLESANENYHEDDVHEVATAKAPLFDLKPTSDQINDYAWNLIYDEWERTPASERLDFFQFLKNNFNSPTRKEKE